MLISSGTRALASQSQVLVDEELANAGVGSGGDGETDDNGW